MTFYIVKVNGLFLSQEWDNIDTYQLTNNIEKDNLRIYQSEGAAKKIAKKLGGVVIPLSEKESDN